MESQKALIVGLGNPGKEYETTRHNLGQLALKAFADKYQLSFKKEKALKGEIAKGRIEERQVFLLFPTTYMNLSGDAVKKAIDFYQIPHTELLILSDDVALPFGALRYRKKGSSGGHNGLKDIGAKLGTEEYQRLRLGIGEPTFGELDRYVLASFTKEEQEKIPEITLEAIQFIEGWLTQDMKEQV